MPIEITELMTWRDEALCRDMPEIDFFPSPEDSAGIERAKEVCAVCPVAAECLDYALETRQADGVWGGLTTKERVKIRRRWLEEVRQAS
jgi:WhiB family redox-sensing transcriptional regulator